MGSQHRTKRGVDSWTCPDVETALMSLKSISSTILFRNTPYTGETFTAQEREWYRDRDLCNRGKSAMIETLVDTVLEWQREV